MYVKCDTCYNHYDDISELPCRPDDRVFPSHEWFTTRPLEAHVMTTRDALLGTVRPRRETPAGGRMRAV